MSMQQPVPVTEIFTMTSGTFMGWRVGNDFFGANGRRAGRFIGDKLYRDDGAQVGWVYSSDPRRVGKKNGYALHTTGNRGTTTQAVNYPIPTNLAQNNNAAWTDPDPI